MIKAIVSVNSNFYGVGQGLFAAGCINFDVTFSRECKRIVWVYDCGTDSSQSYIDAAIVEFDNDYYLNKDEDDKIIDLLVISHFDHDHISGLVKLLAKYKVKRLLLPHMPLWQRLLYFVTSGKAFGSPYYQFSVDPVGFVMRYARRGRPDFIFVPPSDEPVILPPENQPPVLDDIDIDFEIDTVDMPPESDSDDGVRDEIIRWRGSNASVRYLAPGGKLNIRGLWEFVPYNDANKSMVFTSALGSKIRILGKNFIGAKNDSLRKSFLYDIRNLYDTAAGGAAFDRNIISLFLYGRIIQGSHVLDAYKHIGRLLGQSSCNHFSISSSGSYSLGKPSVLYTGDGYLDSAARFNALQTKLGSARMKNIEVFQVMHHGASANWMPGLAAKINPRLSVFSSNPSHGRLKHPHAVVLRDFASYVPVLAEKDKHVKVFFAPVFLELQ